MGYKEGVIKKINKNKKNRTVILSDLFKHIVKNKIKVTENFMETELHL
jgi:hypothetical protein